MENQKQQLKDETNCIYVRANVFSKNFEPIDKFSTGILANIKKINEEKDKTSGVQKNFDDTKERCKQFNEEYKIKYDEIFQMKQLWRKIKN